MLQIHDSILNFPIHLGVGSSAKVRLNSQTSLKKAKLQGELSRPIGYDRNRTTMELGDFLNK